LAASCTSRASNAVTGTGVARGTNIISDVPTPAGVATVTGPAPTIVAGAVAVIWVGESTTNAAAKPLNCTANAPVKSVPAMVTEVSPSRPELRLSVEMAGIGIGPRYPSGRVISGSNRLCSPSVIEMVTW
jgi:hypothetical protein